jgi:hypothetical protein
VIRNPSNPAKISKSQVTPAGLFVLAAEKNRIAEIWLVAPEPQKLSGLEGCISHKSEPADLR